MNDMSQIKQMMSSLESASDPDLKDIERMLYIYSEIAEKPDGTIKRNELFWGLMRLEGICRKNKLPVEVSLYCYKLAFGFRPSTAEHCEKYFYNFIRIYYAYSEMYETDEDDTAYLKALSESALKTAARLEESGMEQALIRFELYEARILGLLFSLLKTDDERLVYASAVVILNTKAGYKKAVTRENAMRFFRTSYNAYSFIADRGMLIKTGNDDIITETLIESAALSLEGLATGTAREDQTRALMYYKKALDLRIKYSDVPYETYNFQYISNRYNKLRLLVESGRTNTGLISEFADGYRQLYQAYKGIRDDEYCDLYKEISDFCCDELLKRGKEYEQI